MRGRSTLLTSSSPRPQDAHPLLADVAGSASCRGGSTSGPGRPHASTQERSDRVSPSASSRWCWATSLTSVRSSGLTYSRGVPSEPVTGSRSASLAVHIPTRSPRPPAPPCRRTRAESGTCRAVSGSRLRPWVPGSGTLKRSAIVGAMSMDSVSPDARRRATRPGRRSSSGTWTISRCSHGRTGPTTPRSPSAWP